VFDAAVKANLSFDEYHEHHGTEQVVVQFQRGAVPCHLLVEALTNETILIERRNAPVCT
jgi:hypothetical protein